MTCMKAEENERKIVQTKRERNKQAAIAVSSADDKCENVAKIIK